MEAIDDPQHEGTQIAAPDACPEDRDQLGKASKCAGCPGQALCQSMSRTDPDQEALDIRMRAIKHKIIVMSGKGGVGKSTVAAQLAIGLAEKGKKVAVLDVDICGPSIPKLLRVENSEIVNTQWGWTPIKSPVHPNIVVMSIAFMLGNPNMPVVWRGPRKTAMIKRFLKETFWGRLDYLVIDTPPGTSDEHLSTLTALSNAKPDGAVLVTTPQEVALDTVSKEINFCAKMQLPVLGLVENMSGFVCPCCNEVTAIFKQGGGAAMCDKFRVKLLAQVPLDPRIAQASEQGESVYATLAESPSVQALLGLVDQVIAVTP